MIEILIYFVFPASYFFSMIIFGSKYSSKMQTINSLTKKPKSRKHKWSDTQKIILENEEKIKKEKNFASLFFSILLLTHWSLMFFYFKSTTEFEYISFALLPAGLLYLALRVVYWLKGHGTIDTKAKLPGNDHWMT